nr:protein NRT1/ PTR FAMILY 1.2-like [Tanacetum cinerariifolium]
MILLWLTTILPNSKPPLCDLRVPKSCQSRIHVQYSLFFPAFALMSIGAGGIRPCSLAFGANQIECKDNPKRERLLESFFGWYYALALMGVLIAFKGIVYIQDNHGRRVEFWILVILMLISTLSFILAYPLYYKMKVEKSLFTSLCQVVSAAWKNRKVTLSDLSDGSCQRQKYDTTWDGTSSEGAGASSADDIRICHQSQPSDDEKNKKKDKEVEDKIVKKAVVKEQVNGSSPLSLSALVADMSLGAAKPNFVSTLNKPADQLVPLNRSPSAPKPAEADTL